MMNPKKNYPQEEIKELEEKLIETYKHLGVVNRRLSILLDLTKKEHSDPGAFLDFMINSLSNCSQTPIVCLFKYKKNHLSILAGSKIFYQQKKGLIINRHDSAFLNRAVRDKVRIQGLADKKLLSLFPSNIRFRYYLFLPMNVGNRLRGLLFWGFSKKESLLTQEIEFYEAFASQASFILYNLGYWK